jgi:hypothetical protein
VQGTLHAEIQCLLFFSYQHVRIDPVHYCELEVELAAKRKHRSFFDRNGEPIDAPKTRLMLFMRTVRDSRRLADKVLSLRMPYMTREASKAELARTVSVLPNLRYVDLPAGFYGDDASSYTLKQELMARCPDIRRMRYARGAEGSFSRLPGSQLWVNLEFLELSDLQIEERTLRLVLHSFPALRSLKLEDLPWLGDAVFAPSPSLPPFPPLQQLTLHDIPDITANGLTAYLCIPQNRDTLKTLTVSNTGLLPQSLHMIFSRAPYLQHVSMVQDMQRSFPAENIPLLSSNSLRTMHYEITSECPSYGRQPISASYYTYLMSSLLSHSLPTLRKLYVRDAGFPETLLLSPPPCLYGGGESGPQPSKMGLKQPLSLYSKGMDELEWNYTEFDPVMTGRPMTPTRPASFHSAQLSPSWGGDARRSMIVGNGFGGFLAVPVEEGRRRSSAGSKRESKLDLWR